MPFYEAEVRGVRVEVEYDFYPPKWYGEDAGVEILGIESPIQLTERETRQAEDDCRSAAFETWDGGEYPR